MDEVLYMPTRWLSSYEGKNWPENPNSLQTTGSCWVTWDIYNLKGDAKKAAEYDKEEIIPIKKKNAILKGKSSTLPFLISNLLASGLHHPELLPTRLPIIPWDSFIGFTSKSLGISKSFRAHFFVEDRFCNFTIILLPRRMFISYCITKPSIFFQSIQWCKFPKLPKPPNELVPPVEATYSNFISGIPYSYRVFAPRIRVVITSAFCNCKLLLFAAIYITDLYIGSIWTGRYRDSWNLRCA